MKKRFVALTLLENKISPVEGGDFILENYFLFLAFFTFFVFFATFFAFFLAIGATSFHLRVEREVKCNFFQTRDREKKIFSFLKFLLTSM